MSHQLDSPDTDAAGNEILILSASRLAVFGASDLYTNCNLWILLWLHVVWGALLF